jgi:F-type H+-transporting ATPase subunit c
MIDFQSMKLIAMGLVVGLGVLGPGIGIGLIGNGAMNALGRNPSVEGKIRSMMILAIAFAESLAIFALLFGFIFLGTSASK